jgi:L-rhamnose mutarotase
MTRYCLLLDLRDDPELIAEYERQHAAVWPEVIAHLRAAGVANMTIWRLGCRLTMLLEAGPDFSFDRLHELEQRNPRIQEWETLMARYQLSSPEAGSAKWQLASPLFELAALP